MRRLYPSSRGSRVLWWTAAGLLTLTLVVLAVLTTSQHTPASAQQNEYVIVAWNDLGMHCYDRDYSQMAVLPPYNTLWAQVIRRGGEEPRIITRNITVEYSIEGNTHSDDKTNFWQYANALLGVDLPPNVGLAGKGLSGTMDVKGSYFVAEGIPLTEFPDATPDQPNYFQLAHIVAKDSAGNVLAETRVVAPVSSEMRCDTCHSEDGPDVKLNILKLHDAEEGTDLVNARPVLCAGCHADPALGLAGQPDVSTLSAAMHGKHAEEASEGVDVTDCYACHPGPATKCLRDVHAENHQMTCVDCHGDMTQVADPTRTPWKSLPSCGNSECHGTKFGENPGQLYRFSTGHSGVYCEGCHNSTHAIWPSREANDNLAIITLQGQAASLSDCMVCHTMQPERDEGPHGSEGEGD